MIPAIKSDRPPVSRQPIYGAIVGLCSATWPPPAWDGCWLLFCRGWSSGFPTPSARDNRVYWWSSLAVIWEEIDLGLVEYSFTTLKFRMVIIYNHYQVSLSSLRVVNEIILLEGPTLSGVFLIRKRWIVSKWKRYRYVAIFFNVGHLKLYSLLRVRS